MSKNNHRKCAKCGTTRSDDMTIPFFRFPKPGKYKMAKAQHWAKYCWPSKDWTSKESLHSLYNSNKVLCARHFTASKFYDIEKQKLIAYAVPDIVEEHNLSSNQKNYQIENDTENLKLKLDTGPHKVDCQELLKSEKNEEVIEDYLTLPLTEDDVIIEVTTSEHVNETNSNKVQVGKYKR